MSYCRCKETARLRAIWRKPYRDTAINMNQILRRRLHLATSSPGACNASPDLFMLVNA